MFFEMGGTVAVLWDVPFRTCSIQLITFFCNCPQAFSPCSKSASMWYIHVVVWIWPLRFFLSVRSDFHLTDSISIAVHAFACPLMMLFSVDETLLPTKNSFRERLVWRCLLLIKSHVLFFVCVDMEVYAICCLFQTAAGNQPGRVYLPEAQCNQRSLRP